MTSIEYRLLLAEAADPDGDRWVVGVVHWDGRALRHAFQPSKVAPRRGLPKLVTAVQRSIAARSRNAPTLGGLQLRDVLPVQEGQGGSLRWGQLRTARTRAENGEAHFRFLCEEHGLTKKAKTARAPTLKQEVLALGESLAARYGDRVVVADHVEGLPPEVRPDLSWMNGKWHHAFTASPADNAAETVEHYAAAAARGMFIPLDRVTMVIALDSADASITEALHAATKQMSARGGVQPILLPSEPTKRWRDLEARIENDVTAPRGITP